ncbi:MAG: 2-phospho-L-lactate transferase [Anaerolineales bacterium]|nr:MAG: 2-phospho-L-lactate transferase [Anaerolineales bacterium]
MNILALAGGVGGAKLAHGLAQILPPEDLTVIVNTGDDFEHLGLSISPDLDTVCYTLAGLANPDTGWGRAGETWNAMANLKRLGAADWFNLGDSDLATHVERTRRLKEGQSLSRVTRDFCKAWGVKHTVLPMSDQPVRTIIETDEGDLPFQEYFVHRGCRPRVKGFRFEGLGAASPAAGTREAFESADAIVVCPSNPWVSVDPILAVLRLPPSAVPRVAVSPIIAGQTVKGPAAKMYAELGIEPSALAVAGHYENFLTGIVVDSADSELAKQIKIQTLVTNTYMKTVADRARLAREVLQFIGNAT